MFVCSLVKLWAGSPDAQDASDGPDRGAEEEAGETAGTRREGRRSGGHHHRYVVFKTPDIYCLISTETCPFTEWACPCPPSDLRNTPYRRTDGRRTAQRQDTWAFFFFFLYLKYSLFIQTKQVLCIQYIKIYNKQNDIVYFRSTFYRFVL